MKKELKTSHALAIVFGWFFITVIMILMIWGPLKLTGLAVYENQPDSGLGQDSYIREGSDTNYGTAITMKIGQTAASSEFRGLLKIDVSSVPSTDTVIDAKIQLYLSTISSNNSMTIKIYRIISDWDQIEAGWNNRTSTQIWTSPGGDYLQELDSMVLNDTLGYYNFSILDAARGWVDGSYNNYGIMIVSEDALDGDTKEFSSSNETIAAQRPKIIIEHIPNAAPTPDNISTNSNATSRIQIGSQVTFTVNWSDLENDDARMFVCNSSLATLSGCTDKTFCSTSLDSTNPMECLYTTTTQENTTTPFWVTTCDDINCSTSTQNEFYVNHHPSTIVVQPNGGETVNQSVGNYPILFNVSDNDSDMLTANIYYGPTQGSTENIIITGINLSTYCTEDDSDTSTANPCNYSWYSAGLYGTYFLTIIVNDSTSIANDSSDATFDVRSLIDLLNPEIAAQWTESNIHSGKEIYFHANATDLNINTVWVSINTTPQTNITMLSNASPEYNVSWIAQEVGTYSFKVWANDTVGNTNDTMPWTNFNISKPIATTQNEISPSIALPYNVIEVTGELNASDSIRNAYAYLNIPEGFTFLSGYPQNLYLGNFSDNETKTAIWFLSTPITESIYTLNITYTDEYSNQWNSSDTQTQVTSSIGGGYDLSISGYPEVETTYDYFVEAFFESAGTYVNADSTTVLIYDSTGSVIVGPVSMNNPSTGNYNYTYTVPAAPNEGQWQTIINATKNGVSYYASQFWEVVGGPFDVRDIVINDNIINDLGITVTTENTGGAIKDLILTWNLTREDTHETLDSGADTFAVDPYTTKDWTINPTTTYVGQTRITFLGFYSGTEKAGAYKVFSTTNEGVPVTPPSTSTGGGGGGTAETIIVSAANISLEKLEKRIHLSKNIEKNISLEIFNNGNKTLTQLSLTLDGAEESCTIIPQIITSLEANKTAFFTATCKVIGFIGEKDFTYIVKSNEITLSKSGTLVVLSMADFFQEELDRLTKEINILKPNANEDLNLKLNICEEILKNLESNIEKEEFINAKDTVVEAEGCIQEAKNIAPEIKKKPFMDIKMTEYWIWIVTWGLITLLIIVLGVIVYMLYKKSDLTNYVNRNQPTKIETPTMKGRLIEDRLKSIKERLG